MSSASIRTSAPATSRTGPRSQPRHVALQPRSGRLGAIGDLATHVLTSAGSSSVRIVALSAVVKTFVPGRKVDDAVEAVVEFETGTVGTIEATGSRSGVATRSSGRSTVEGVALVRMERMNELQVFRATATAPAARRLSSSARPTIPSTRTGGRPVRTSSAGATRSCTRSPPAARDRRGRRGRPVRSHLRGRGRPRIRGLRTSSLRSNDSAPRGDLLPLPRTLDEWFRSVVIGGEAAAGLAALPVVRRRSRARGTRRSPGSAWLASQTARPSPRLSTRFRADG